MSGRPLTVTSSGKSKDYEKRWNNWTRPLRKATEEVNKKLLMKAFEIALKLVMKNHIFTFKDENFKHLSRVGPRASGAHREFGVEFPITEPLVSAVSNTKVRLSR